MMKEIEISNAIEKIFTAVFNCKNPFTLEEIYDKFAFDIKLPQKVTDTTTGEDTWASSINPTKFITNENSNKRENWMLEKKDISSLKELIDIWQTINYRTTQRVFNCVNVSCSDAVYNSENVYRSTDCNECKNLILSDGCHHCEYTLASQRSGNCAFCIRVDDSSNCTNSYNVACSGNISNSMFIEDCGSLDECMFCAHISNHKFCIANMQFEEEEYYEIKKEIINWIMNS